MLKPVSEETGFLSFILGFFGKMGDVNKENNGKDD